jgi:glycosyltransferase 2 family protein
MIKRYKRGLILLIKTLISITIIFFIVRYLKINVHSLDNYTIRFNYFFLAISFLLLLAYLINQSFLWYYITIKNECNIDLRTSIISRVYSEFGKYIPGKVFGYAMLLYAYSKANQSKMLVAFCMFLELLASVLATSLIFLFSVFFTNVPTFEKYRVIALVFLVLFFLLIHPKILNYFSVFFFKIAKREPVQLSLSYIQLLKIIFLYVANFLIFGVAFVIFINSIYPVSFSDYLYITGTTAGAGLIGLFAIFVPAGLGVREGVMLFTLSIIIPSAFAGIIALTSRIWLTLGEVFLFGLVYVFTRTKLIKIPTK